MGTPQPSGPFPPLSVIPPLFPPTPPSAQPRKPGPDAVTHASCKSKLNPDQARIIVYDASSFISCQSLSLTLSCPCSVNDDSCQHVVQVLHIPRDDKPPVWSVAKTSKFSTVFSSLSLQGHLAVMDAESNLYVPILEGAIDYVENDHISSDLRHACVKTIANVLAIIHQHPRANLSSLLLEPCSASLCDLRFRDLIAIVDFARRQIPNTPNMRLEARVVTPSKTRLSYCKHHPRAPRVCVQCFFQVDESSPASSCPHCYKQYFSLQPQPPKSSCPLPDFDEPEPPMQTAPSPPSYAKSVKTGLPTDTQPPTPPPQVITKITNIERQMQAQSENFRAVLDQLHALSQTQNTFADKLSQLEDSSSWRETKHKSCQSTKKVDSNFASLKKLGLELATLTAQVKELKEPCSPPVGIVKLSAQITDLNKQVTDIQATLYKQLTSANTPSTSADTPSTTTNTPPPTNTDPFGDDDIVDI